MRKKKEIITRSQPIIHYESESVDVTKFCCEALLEQNFYHNNGIENIKKLEDILFHYSMIKILTWDKELENNNTDYIEEISTLEGISNVIKNKIPTETQKNSYFAQYIHCIIYILGVINNHHQIEWLENNSSKDIIIRKDNDIITEIITPKNMPYEQIPNKLIDKIKALYTKGPVLKK